MFRPHKSPNGLAEEIYNYFLYQCRTVLKKKNRVHFLSVTTLNKDSLGHLNAGIKLLCRFSANGSVLLLTVNRP